MTLKFTGKAGRASSLAQMKDLIKRFEDSKTRIQKLRIFKEMIQTGEARQMVLTNNKNYKELAKRRHLVQLKSQAIETPGIVIRVSSPPKEGTVSSDMNERVPEEIEEVREEEEQVAGDSDDDEEGQQVYSEML